MSIKLNGKPVDLTQKFPDGTFAFGHTVKNFGAIVSWHYECEEEAMALYYLVRHLRDHNCRNIALKMPYVPNARMDRVQAQQNVFTLKYFAEFINALNFSQVAILDPHSNVTPALINNVIVDSPRAFIEQTLEDIGDPDLGIFYPDEGSLKRYHGMLKMPSGFGIKERDWETGKILKLKLADFENIAGKNILIVDDICSRGGTFYHSARALKENGVGDIYLYCTHCENTIFSGELLKAGFINRIYTTNSTLTKSHNKITAWNCDGCFE